MPHLGYGARTARWRHDGDGPVGNGNHADSVLVCHRVLGEARRQVHVVAKLAQPVDVGPAGPAGVEDKHDLQMLIFAEHPRHQAAGSGRRFPVDRMAWIARAVLSQVVQLLAGTGSLLSGEARLLVTRGAAGCHQHIGNDGEFGIQGLVGRPPAEFEGPFDAHRQALPRKVAERQRSHGKTNALSTLPSQMNLTRCPGCV